ncbi:MAG TPA: hypothetical protein DIT32_02775 [Peptococcaceae bacterium]|nr:hypothetical protein [Peptococcaceae bacterium]
MDQIYTQWRLYEMKLEGACRTIIRNFWRDQRGDLVGSLGWMAITALLLVAVSTVLNGKMTGLAESIFAKLESLLI